MGTLDVVLVALVADQQSHGLGGVQAIVDGQARALARLGHRVRLVTSAPLQAALPLDGSGVERHYLPVLKSSPDFTAAAWYAACRAAWPSVLAGGRPDVVHGHAEAEVGLVRAGLVGARTGVAWTATLYGSPLAGVLDGLRIPAHKNRLRDVWRRFKSAAGVLPTLARGRDYRGVQVICLSTHHARRVAVSYPGVRPRVVPPGVDLTLYSPASPDAKAAARRSLDLPEIAFVWTTVGRLARGKDVATAIGAFAEWANAVDSPAARPPRLVVAGDGPERAELERQVGRLGIENLVRFAGAIIPPVNAYSAADGALFPTLHDESYGMVAAEAMASGLPVLASRRGAVPEVLGDTGRLVEPGRLAAWISTMGTLAEDASVRTAMGRRARERAEGGFGLKDTADRLTAMYQGLIQW